MTLLHGVSYVAVVVVMVFVTLSLASGLLWLAEVIEEHSRTAKIVGKRIAYAVIIFHILLFTFDANLPFAHIAFSIACHLVYLLNFTNFPLINLTSWSFVASCLMVVADHFLWFSHFHNVLEGARKRERRWLHPMEPVPHVPSFLDISAFFGICVWLVPLFLFLSLSANDNALPTTSRHDLKVTLMPAYDPSQATLVRAQRSSLFVSLSTKVVSFLQFDILTNSFREKLAGWMSLRSVNRRPPSPVLHDQMELLSKTQRRPISPMPSPSMTPRSRQHSPAPSPYRDEGSWMVVDGGSQGADENTARRRVNLQAASSG